MNRLDIKEVPISYILLFILNKSVDSISFIITLHKYIEFLIDVLLKEKLNYSTKKIKYLGFSDKLKVISDQSLIPSKLSDNLSNLNRIRNNYAHDLYYNISLSDFIFNYPNDDMRLRKYEYIFKDKEGNIILNKGRTRDNLFRISIATYGWLSNYCLFDLELVNSKEFMVNNWVEKLAAFNKCQFSKRLDMVKSR